MTNILPSLIAGSGIPVKKHGMSAFPSGGVEPIDDEDLKAYWKFNEGSGNIINESSSDESLGSGADLTPNGGITYGVTGTPTDFGDGVEFDGTDDYAVAGTSKSQWNFISNQSAVSTFIWWAKYLSTPAEVYTIGTVFTEGSQVGTMIRNESTKFRFHISRGVDNTRTLSQITSADFIPDTTSWHMYVWAWDYGGSSPQSYVRRDNDNEETQAKTGSGASNADNTYALNVARRPGSNNDFANFQACEWSIWNKIVSDDDQTSLYNNGAGREIY